MYIIGEVSGYDSSIPVKANRELTTANSHPVSNPDQAEPLAPPAQTSIIVPGTFSGYENGIPVNKKD